MDIGCVSPVNPVKPATPPLYPRQTATSLARIVSDIVQKNIKSGRNKLR